jgi:LysM repeat protein
MHRNTGDTESIIVEYGFIDDTSDNVKFLNDNYKQLAEAVIEAIADYKGLNYTSPFGTTTTYTVKKGDSLYSIANKYNTTVDALKTLNNLTTNTLSIGQTLKLPGSTGTSSQTTTYTVKSGDTLYSIANKYNTTVNNIKTTNNLTSNTLKIGQVLKIPGRETTSGQTEVSEVITYTVKSGDTINSIANKYNISVDEIINLNNLTSSTLKVGDTILLPIDTIEEITEEETETTTPGTTTTTYTVKSGDTLYSIANKFGTTVAKLKNLNNLTTNTLSIGQTLKVSDDSQTTTPSQTTTTYTVKSGDTLYSIANKYGLSVSEIKSLNNLSSNLLSIGQVLKLPTTTSTTTTTTPTTYTVKSGDTLYSIANKYNTTVANLKSLNNLTTNTLSIGQVLKLK